MQWFDGDPQRMLGLPNPDDEWQDVSSVNNDKESKVKSLLKKNDQRKVSAPEKETLIGNSVHDKRRTPFHLSIEQLRDHSLLLGDPGSGKMAMMRHLANAAIENGAALVVLDEEGDLAPDLLTHVPRPRGQDVTWIDLSDQSVSPGWNVLDVSQGDTPDLIVTNLVRTAPELWGDDWNVRAEDALRMGLQTLLTANRVLAQKNDAQFTLLDLPPLFELPHFRHRTLQSFVSNYDVLSWWSGYFEQLSPTTAIDLMTALLVPLRRLSFNPTARNILGQSNSTLKLREMVEPGRISLIDTSALAMTPDLRHWLTTAMTERIIRIALARKQASPNNPEPPIVVAINGAIPMACVEGPDWLNYLRKYGVSLILSGWSLGYLKTLAQGLPQRLLANTANLFVFRTSYLDAEMIRGELGESISAQDMTRLPDYTCFVRTQARKAKPVVERIETFAPKQGDDPVRQEMLEQIKPYGRSVADVESERVSFMEKWYGRDQAMLAKLVRDPSQTAKPTHRDRFIEP